MNIACVPCIRMDFFANNKKFDGKGTHKTREKNKLVVVFFVFVDFIAIVYSIRVYHYILYPLVFLFVLWVMEEQRARMYFLLKRNAVKKWKIYFVVLYRLKICKFWFYWIDCCKSLFLCHYTYILVLEWHFIGFHLTCMYV